MRVDWKKKIIADCGLPETEAKNLSSGCLSILNLAAMDGSLETVKYLIEVRGMNPNETLSDDVSALHFAA
jgi:hypothetical protein